METGNKDMALRLEKINSFLHGLGILFGLISMPILIMNARSETNEAGYIGAIIYACCFLMVFVSSTLYHGLQRPRTKQVLQVIDHISIYFLIAGTYTPIILIFVNNTFGITLLIVLWALTLLGIVFKIFFTGRFEMLSIALYIMMGWILFTDSQTFFKDMPGSIIALITIGGVLYCFGVIFYAWHKYRYHHAIWHLCVLAAAICHYTAIFLAM